MNTILGLIQENIHQYQVKEVVIINFPKFDSISVFLFKGIVKI